MPDGNVIYAQMTYGTGMIMLGAVRDTDLDKLMRQPDEVGGVETQSCYVVVEGADAHYARSKNAGAEIVLEIKERWLWPSRLFVPRSAGPYLEFRHL